MKFNQDFLDGCKRCAYDSDTGLFTAEPGFAGCGVKTLNGNLAILQTEGGLPMSADAYTKCSSISALAVNNTIVDGLNVYELTVNGEGQIDIAP